MKTRKHMMPLFSALTASMLCVNFIAFVSANSIYRKYDTDGWSQPAVSVLMQGLAHRDSPRDPAGNRPENEPPFLPTGSQTASVELPDAYASQSSPEIFGNTLTEQDGSSVSGNSQTGQPDGSTSVPSPDTLPEGADTPAQYSFEEVSQDYFDDALLIGDSRATGIQLYSGWDNLTYYAEGGMTVYSMFDCKVTNPDGRTLTMEEALQERSFGKIYLEIGINEMGTGTVDSFMEAYESAVEHLRELQPDAIIYVCAIMYVKQSKSESDPIFNNPNIQARNDRIARLADGEHIFYLDINEVMADETGNLNPDYTWDEVHLLGKYNTLWLEYFCTHGIVKAEK